MADGKLHPRFILLVSKKICIIYNKKDTKIPPFHHWGFLW